MKKIVFATSDIDNSNFTFPFKHASLATQRQTRYMFIPDYHAPLEQVYADNGYDVVKKTPQQAWMDSDNEPFIYMLTPQPHLFEFYKTQQEKLKQYIQSINPFVIDAVNEGRCVFVVHHAKEQYAGDLETEQGLHNFFKDCGFNNPQKIIIIETSHNANTSEYFTFVKWNYFETAVRLMNFNINVADKFKAEYKKFLCLNFTPRYHRRDFMYAMRDLKLLDQFNASLNDRILPLQYDVDDHNIHLKIKNKNTKTRPGFGLEAKPSSGHIPMLIKDINHWNTLSARHSTENLINVVTETAFQNKSLMFITEKTYKAIVLKMPFIMLGNAGTLAYLQSQGYKTFDHMWSEKYDSVHTKDQRMQEVCSVVKKLAMMNNTDLKKLIEQNNHILEHNYNLLMARRPEQVVFDAIDKIISHQ
tara:strand:+ start:297 stop:1544 length:1248 start_codon:yes stop_codon:yes gene_type:complete